jgi:hypothetical protein
MNTTPSFGYTWFKDGSSSGAMSFTIFTNKTDYFYANPQEVINFILLLRTEIERYVLKVIGPNIESVGFSCNSIKIKDLIQQ